MIWFKNIQAFALAADHKLDAEQIQQALTAHPFVAPGNQDPVSHGFVAPVDHMPDLYAIPREGALLVCLRSDQKIIPSSVVKLEIEKREKKIFEEEGRKVGRRELREIKERVIEEMLPRALTKTSYLRALIDLQANRVLVDSGSSSKAEDFLAILRSVLGGGLPTRRIVTKMPADTAMQTWLTDGAPGPFATSSRVELSSPGKERKARLVNVDIDEIKRLLNSGMQCKSLELEWGERISFVLANDLCLKRVTQLDVVQQTLKDSDATDQASLFDAELFLLVSETRNLVTAILDVLGGMEDSAA